MTVANAPDPPRRARARARALVARALPLAPGLLGGYALAATWSARLSPGGELYDALGRRIVGAAWRYSVLVGPCLVVCALLALAAARGPVARIGPLALDPLKRAALACAPLIASPLVLTQDDLVRRDALLALVLGIAAALTAALALDDAPEPPDAAPTAPARAPPLRALVRHAPVLAGIAAHFAAFAWLTINRDRALWSATVDLGIFKEALWNTLHGRAMFSPTVGYSFLGEHFSPVLYLLVPFYRLWPTSATLLVAQAAAVSLAGWPIYRLALARGLGRYVATALALSMLFAPSVQLALMYDFHMDLLGVPALAWAILAAHQRRPLALAVAAALLCSVKEDAFIALAGVALYMYLDDSARRWRAPLVLFVATTAYCALAIKVLIPHFGPPPGVPTYMGESAEGGYKFMRNFHHLAGARFGPLAALARAPARYALWMVTDERFTALCVLFAPLLLAPAFAGRRIVLLAPLGTVLLSDNVDINRLHYHYGAIVHPAVYAAGVYGLAAWVARARPERRAALRTALAIGVATASVATALVNPSSEACAGNTRDAPVVTSHVASFDRLAARVPADAPLSATSFGGPRFSNRRALWMFPRGLEAATYALVDLQRPSWPAHESERDDVVLRMLRSGQWGALGWDDGVLLMARGADAGRNRDAVRALFVHRAYEVEGTEWTDYPRSVDRDAAASEGLARVYHPADPRSGAWVAFGPFARVPGGMQRVHFRLRAAPWRYNGDIGRVDVFVNGTTLADRTLVPEDFPDEGWQDVTLDFDGANRDKVEFRVRTDHGWLLAADRITLEPLAGDDAALATLGF